MYHIKNDKRSQKSAKLISDALTQCLNNKPFSEITITDIQRTSHVGRATFYRLFDNLTDVLAYQCDQIFDDVLEKYSTNPQLSSKEIILLFIDIWLQHEKLLDVIVYSNRLDILIESHKRAEDKIKNIFLPHTEIDDKQFNYLIFILTYLMSGALDGWVKGGRKESPYELLEQLINSLDIIGHILK